MKNTEFQPVSATEPANTPAPGAVQLTAQIGFSSEKFTHTMLFKEENYALILFALNKGQEIAPHKTPRNAYLQCLDGQAAVQIGDNAYVLKKGEIILLPKDLMHSISALKKTKLMLLK